MHFFPVFCLFVVYFFMFFFTSVSIFKTVVLKSLFSKFIVWASLRMIVYIYFVHLNGSTFLFLCMLFFLLLKMEHLNIIMC